ncbi:MAG: DUF4258 domain-containing protein [Proteobacteria bacterium]|nr:DUF4258 domain-containing protein [Pseudomonadota bacterium]
MTYNQNTDFSEHAAKRMQQRGISMADANFILSFADRVVRGTDGSLALSVTTQIVKVSKERGDISPQMAEKMPDKCLVIAQIQSKCEEHYKVITALQFHGKESRMYRKFFPQRCNRSKQWNR